MPKFRVDLQTWGYLSVRVEAKDEKEAWDKVFLHRDYEDDGDDDHEWRVDWDGAWEQLDQETITGANLDTDDEMDPTNLSKRLEKVLR